MAPFQYHSLVIYFRAFLHSPPPLDYPPTSPPTTNDFLRRLTISTFLGARLIIRTHRTVAQSSKPSLFYPIILSLIRSCDLNIISPYIHYT